MKQWIMGYPKNVCGAISITIYMYETQATLTTSNLCTHRDISNPFP